MTQFTKRVLATGAAVGLAALPLLVSAQGILNPSDSTIGGEIGAGSNTDIRTAVISVVSYILGFLGLIAVLIVLYGGFVWMTSGGNEEKVSQARATLTAGLIGLVIILAAYALTQFVIGQIQQQIS